MEAVVKRGKRLVCDVVAEPVPGKGQALLKTLACGICGSDLHALEHMHRTVELSRRAGAANVLDPDADLVFGHEFCGEILDFGPGAARTLKAGTRVVSMPFAEGPNGMELIGYSHRFPGGFGERITATESMLLEVPNGLPSAHAAMVEPMAVGLHAVKKAAPGPKSVALVIGCGPVGLAVIAALKIAGVGPVIASDFSPKRRSLAEALGADIVVDPSAHSPHGHWEQYDVPANLASMGAAQLGGRSIRDAIVFECVGVPGMLQRLIEEAPPTSKIIVVGACQEEDKIEPVMAISKQLDFSFVFAYTPEEFAETLHNLAEGRIDGAKLVTSIVGRSGVADAFVALGNPEAEVKIIIEPGRA